MQTVDKINELLLRCVCILEKKIAETFTHTSHLTTLLKNAKYLMVPGFMLLFFVVYNRSLRVFRSWIVRKCMQFEQKQLTFLPTFSRLLINNKS